MKHRAWLITCAAVLLPAALLAQAGQTATTTASGAAQSVAAPGEEQTSGDQSTPAFEEQVVVTATRYEQDSYETPLPISVVTADDLARQQPEKMVDMLKELAGVEFTGEGPFRGLPVIRGMSSNRVLILVDGQRLNNSRESTQFAGIQPGLVDLSQVERIEVLRGPASVLYGSDAIGGVVNIITRQQAFSPGTFRLGGGLSFEYGSAAESQRARAEVSGASERMTFNLSLGTFEADDYESPEAVVPNSGMKQKSGDLSLRFLVSETGVLRVAAEAVRSDDIGFPGYDPATSGVDITFPRFDRDKYTVAYDVAEVAGLDTLSLSAYTQKVVKESKRNLDFGPYFFSHNFTRSDIDTVGFNAQGAKALGSHRLTFGLDAYQDELQDQTTEDSTFGSSNNVQVPDSTQKAYGLYLQDEMALSSRLNVVAGLRGDRFSFKSKDDPNYVGTPFDESNDAVSGSLGARYAVTDHVELTGTVGRAFRAPNLQERSYFGLVSTGDTWVIQNPNLDPETSLNTEIGFKVRYARYSGSFSLYNNAVKNLISLVFLGEDPNTHLEQARFENIDKSTIRGAEFELQALLGEGFTGFLNTSYTYGRDDKTGDPLPLIAPYKAVVGVRYETPRWWSEFSTRIVARQDRVPPDTTGDSYIATPGFTTYDLRGGVDLSHGFAIQAAAENLSDKTYHEPFNRRFEPGRNFKLGVRYSF